MVEDCCYGVYLLPNMYNTAYIIGAQPLCERLEVTEASNLSYLCASIMFSSWEGLFEALWTAAFNPDDVRGCRAFVPGQIGLQPLHMCMHSHGRMSEVGGATAACNGIG